VVTAATDGTAMETAATATEAACLGVIRHESCGQQGGGREAKESMTKHGLFLFCQFSFGSGPVLARRALR